MEKLAEAKIGERIVKQGGLVAYENQAYWTSREIAGQKIELWQTLKGLEIRKDGHTYDIVSDYWERISRKV